MLAPHFLLEAQKYSQKVGVRNPGNPEIQAPKPSLILESSQLSAARALSYISHAGSQVEFPILIFVVLKSFTGA